MYKNRMKNAWFIKMYRVKNIKIFYMFVIIIVISLNLQRWEW